MRRELCKLSSNLTNFSVCKTNKHNKVHARQKIDYLRCNESSFLTTECLGVSEVYESKSIQIPIQYSNTQDTSLQGVSFKEFAFVDKRIFNLTTS